MALFIGTDEELAEDNIVNKEIEMLEDLIKMTNEGKIDDIPMFFEYVKSLVRKRRAEITPTLKLELNKKMLIPVYERLLEALDERQALMQRLYNRVKPQRTQEALLRF